jgi:carbon monoxide dehydrogenase subunit G
MESTQSYSLPVPPPRAWEALTDAQVLLASIAGCEQIQADREDAFAFVVHWSQEGLKARFSGHLRMSDIDPPRACKLRFESDAGSEAGTVASAHLHLEADGDASTTLSYRAEIRADGASGALQKIADQFGERFAACLALAAESGVSIDIPTDAPQPSGPSLQHAAVFESAPAGKGEKCWKAWTAKS